MEAYEVLLISPKDAQKILGVGHNRIYELIKEPGFPAFKMGSKFFVNKSALQSWIDSQCKIK